MKKFLLLVGIVSLFGTAIGQGAMKVSPIEFTSNSSKFNGKMISISPVQIVLDGKTHDPRVVGPMTPNVLSSGPGPAGVGTQVLRCNAPRSFKSIEIDFPSDPNYNACFFISEAMFNSLPKGQPSVNAEIVFKGDSRVGYTITMFKLK